MQNSNSGLKKKRDQLLILMYLNHKKLIFLCEMSRAVGQIFAYSGVGERKRYVKMEWDKMDIFLFFLYFAHLASSSTSIF